ncbi:MAG: ABC transporter permease [Microbacter sp.]
MILWHLLRKNLALGQVIGYVLATLLGLTIVLMTLQFSEDLRPVFSEKEGIFAHDYLLISKKVSVFKTLGITKSSFSKAELQELTDQPFVHRLAPFTTANFKVYASLSMGNKMTNLGTMLFFESVPDAFLDVTPADWKWTPGSHFIPIVLPRSYLTIYNFGFAPSQGLPQLSGNMLSNINLTIEVAGHNKEAMFQSRIVGFTDRINSILVPQSFMDWANSEFGFGHEDPTHLILEPNNIADPLMMQFFSSHDYEVANDKAVAGEASSFLRTLIFVVLSVGAIITLLALGLMLLSINLLIEKNHERIENLSLAGFSSEVISKPYQYLVMGVNGFIFILSMLLVIYLRHDYISLFSATMHVDHAGFLWNNFLWGGVIVLILTTINMFWIFRKVREICR